MVYLHRPTIFAKLMLCCVSLVINLVSCLDFRVYDNSYLRKYPGLVKVVVAKIRDHIHPSYMQPTDPFDDFQNQAGLIIFKTI